MSLNDDAARIIEARDAASQRAVKAAVSANAAALARETRQLQATAAERLRRAKYPQNRHFAWCANHGSRVPIWCVYVGQQHQEGEWLGVLADGNIVWLRGDLAARDRGTLRVTSTTDLASFDRPFGVMALAALKSVLETVDRSPDRRSWEV